MTEAHQPTPEERSAFDERLAVAQAQEELVQPKRYVNGKEIIWEAQNGSQKIFMKLDIFEVLYHGTRGPGKTDGLLMDYAQHVGKGHGAAWRGVIFRQTYPQLADIQAKSEKWFRQIFGRSAKFNKTKMQWEWNTGEVLMFRHMNRPGDYWNYHGHEYPFIGFEELCNWNAPDCYTSMFACCRCSTPGVPRMVRATTNPYGAGHSWVKERFRLHNGAWRTRILFIDNPTDENGRKERPRCAVYGHLRENKILLAADPDYEQTIVAASTSPAMSEAWLEGSWDIVAGGMFGDVWNVLHNVVPKFTPPHTWRIDRAFDWGSSAPFSVGWWAQSDGSDVEIPGKGIVSTVRGDLFRIAEWYGWSGRPNQGLTMLAVDIAKGIVERELLWGLRSGHGPNEIIRVRAGPADSSIYNVENGMSIALDMGKPVRIGPNMHKGVKFVAADKRAGSRKTGWEHMRKMMLAAHPSPGRPREHPGLFVLDHCEQFQRTVPSLPRDEKDMDDVDTNAEDHQGDETRYRVRQVGNRGTTGTHIGMW